MHGEGWQSKSRHGRKVKVIEQITKSKEEPRKDQEMEKKWKQKKQKWKKGKRL
jgi:hypothetical protein